MAGSWPLGSYHHIVRFASTCAHRGRARGAFDERDGFERSELVQVADDEVVGSSIAPPPSTFRSSAPGSLPLPGLRAGRIDLEPCDQFTRRRPGLLIALE
jgi:hypothetical protein